MCINMSFTLITYTSVTCDMSYLSMDMLLVTLYASIILYSLCCPWVLCFIMYFVVYLEHKIPDLHYCLFIHYIIYYTAPRPWTMLFSSAVDLPNLLRTPSVSILHILDSMRVISTMRFWSMVSWLHHVIVIQRIYQLNNNAVTLPFYHISKVYCWIHSWWLGRPLKHTDLIALWHDTLSYWKKPL